MAPNARPTAAKRNREKALVERRQEKEARRRDAKERKQSAGPRMPGDEDPAIQAADQSGDEVSQSTYLNQLTRQRLRENPGFFFA